ncbi:MAG: hypothetical protein AB1772_12535 [Candidatus Zixiibacteriota bacterium]
MRLILLVMLVGLTCVSCDCDFLECIFDPPPPGSGRPGPGHTGGDGDTEEPELACNSETHTVAAGGDAGSGRYVWLGLMDHDRLVAHGEATFLIGPYQDVPLSIQVGYWSDVPAGGYILQVFETTDSADIGNPKARVRAATAALTEVQSYGTSEDHACCTRVGGASGRKYCTLHIPVLGCTGTSAKIKARYGLPCGYPDSAVNSFNVTYVNVLQSIYDLTSGAYHHSWAQTGVGWERRPLGHGGDKGVELISKGVEIGKKVA